MSTHGHSMYPFANVRLTIVYLFLNKKKVVSSTILPIFADSKYFGLIL